MTTQEMRDELKRLCPGEAYHAKTKGEAELVANMMMDRVHTLLDMLDWIEENGYIADKPKAG